MTNRTALLFVLILLADSYRPKKTHISHIAFISPPPLDPHGQASSPIHPNLILTTQTGATSPDFIETRTIETEASERSATSPKKRIAILNFKCYLDNDGYDKIIQRIDSLNIPNNVKLLISAPSVYLHKFTKLPNFNEKYELCAQQVGLATGFGPYTGELTPEMLKDVGVNWCLIGHKEFTNPSIAKDFTDPSATQAYKDNATRLANAIRAGITPILILSGDESAKDERKESGYEGFDAKNEAKTLIAKLDRYHEVLSKSNSQILLGYEPQMSVGTGIPMAPAIAGTIKAEIDSWAKNRLLGSTGIDILYGGSLSATNTKEYFTAGFSGLLFGKICTTVDVQTILDSFN